jgi:hypothetical protein
MYKTSMLLTISLITMQYKVNALPDNISYPDLNMPNDILDLKTINIMTFYANRETFNLKELPVQELNCVQRIDICNIYKIYIKVVQCHNNGIDDRGIIQWDCTCNETPYGRYIRLLPNANITCEKYDKPYDMYQVAGSCHLDYTLEYGYQWSTSRYNSDRLADAMIMYLKIILCMGSIALLCYCCNNTMSSNEYYGRNDYPLCYYPDNENRNNLFNGTLIDKNVSDNHRNYNHDYGTYRHTPAT